MKLIRDIYLAGFLVSAIWQIAASATPLREYGLVSIIRVVGISAVWPAVAAIIAMYKAGMIQHPG